VKEAEDRIEITLHYRIPQEKATHLPPGTNTEEYNLGVDYRDRVMAKHGTQKERSDEY
tara:strand:+ start:723 stop:896 length:174 start_codon:yes stop_codon:yes gene_type:complete